MVRGPFGGGGSLGGGRPPIGLPAPRGAGNPLPRRRGEGGLPHSAQRVLWYRRRSQCWSQLRGVEGSPALEGDVGRGREDGVCRRQVPFSQVRGGWPPRGAPRAMCVRTASVSCPRERAGELNPCHWEGEYVGL